MNITRETWSILAIAGVILIIFGAVTMFINVSFATTSVSTYYYYVPGVGTVSYLTVSATSNTSYNFKVNSAWGATGAKIEVTFPSGSSGNVTFRIANITENQLSHFGASSLPAGLNGKAFFDIMLNISYTGTSPEIYLYINVTNSNVKAYLWNASSNSWKYVTGQSMTLITTGVYELKIPLTENLTGTPLVLVAPAPVGGRLALHTKTGHIAITLVAIGLALIGIASAILIKERKRHL